MNYDLSHVKKLVDDILNVNAKAAGWNGMNGMSSEAMPGGSTATDTINALRKASIQFAYNIRNGRSDDVIAETASEIEGYLHTLVVIEQLSDAYASELIDQLHITINSD